MTTRDNKHAGDRASVAKAPPANQAHGVSSGSSTREMALRDNSVDQRWYGSTNPHHQRGSIGARIPKGRKFLKPTFRIMTPLPGLQPGWRESTGGQTCPLTR